MKTILQLIQEFQLKIYENHMGVEVKEITLSEQGFLILYSELSRPYDNITLNGPIGPVLIKREKKE